MRGMITARTTIAAAVLTAAALLATDVAAAQAVQNDAIKLILEDADAGYWGGSASPAEREQMAKLYESGGYRLMWSDGRKPTAQAQALLHELQHAADRGLDVEDYAGDRLEALLTNTADPETARGALFDVALSLCVAHFLTDLHYGRIDPTTVGHNLSVERIKLDIPTALAKLAVAPDPGAAIDALEPQFIHYALLKRQLARYRQLATDQSLGKLPPLPTKSLRPGDRYSGAPQLQRLLMALGDAQPITSATPASTAALPSTAPSAAVLTPALVDALKHFQQRHGEKPDGVLGAATYKELTTPLTRRARQIELTMERWRWLPELTSAPIIVNIPQFRLFAFESTTDAEARIRQMDVIVGKAFEATQTPIFSAYMTYLIFRPYWEIPYSIAVKEIIPAARRNPESIEKHQMEIVSGGGEAAAVMPPTSENLELVAKGALRLRQKPGPNNSLGLIKFMLPNSHNVYLHSTPAQSLFAESRRDFSHGCVRVADPVGLAQYVLRDSPEWTREKIVAAMNGATSQTVTLKRRIPVFFVYGTAVAGENGEVFFFDDIYGHDERLEQALDAHRPRRGAGSADAQPAGP